MRSEGFGLHSMWIRNSTQHKVGLQLGLCTEMKPSDLIRCPDFSECYLFKLCPKPRILYRCPHRPIDIEDLIYSNAAHPDIVQPNADLQ